MLALTVDGDGNTKQFIFRACFIDPFQGLVMAKFAQGKGFKTAFIMYDQGNDYVRGLAEAFEAVLHRNGRNQSLARKPTPPPTPTSRRS